MESLPETARKVGAVVREWEKEEEEGTPVKSKSGRRWSVMEKKMQEEGMMTARKPERSRSVSPSKEMSPARFDGESCGRMYQGKGADRLLTSQPTLRASSSPSLPTRTARFS